MQRLLAIGDIHGCFDSLKKLIEEKIHIQRSDRVVFLGDYIDRGPKTKEVIDYVISLKSQGFDIITLLGNHEKMLIDAFTDDDKIILWLYNGGGETLRSFGLDSTAGLSDKYWIFFTELRYYYSYEDFIFVHAGFNDRIENPFEDKYQMLWTRSDDYTNPVFKGKTIIHGHTPISLEMCKSNMDQKRRVINIDTGCVFKYKPGCGILTGLDVFSDTVFTA